MKSPPAQGARVAPAAARPCYSRELDGAGGRNRGPAGGGEDYALHGVYEGRALAVARRTSAPRSAPSRRLLDLATPTRRLPFLARRCASQNSALLLQLQQLSLAFQPTGVAGQRAVGADHPVARDHDRDRVATVGQADRARGRVGLPTGRRSGRTTRSRRSRSARSWVHTRRWKSVPTGASGRSNSSSSRAKYAVSWRTVSASTGSSSSRAPSGRPSPVGGTARTRSRRPSRRARRCGGRPRGGHHGPHVSSPSCAGGAGVSGIRVFQRCIRA